mgnify:CR=1 FL=1
MHDNDPLPPPNQAPPTQAVTQEDVMQNLPVLNIVIDTIDKDTHNYTGRLVVNTSEGWAQVLLQEEGQPLAVVMFMLDKVVKIASHEVQ